MKKKILSIVLALAMVLSFFLGMTITADAAQLIGTHWAVTDTADVTPEYGEEKDPDNLDNDWAAIKTEVGTGKYVHMMLAEGMRNYSYTLPTSNNLTGAGWKGLIIDLNRHTFYLENGPLSADFDVTIKSNSCDTSTWFVGMHGITLTGDNSALTFLNLNIAAFNSPFASTGPMTIEADKIEFNENVSITAPAVTLKAREENGAKMQTYNASNVFMNSNAAYVFDNVTGELTASTAVFDGGASNVTIISETPVCVKVSTETDGSNASILDSGMNFTVTVPADTRYFAIEPGTGGDPEACWGTEEGTYTNSGALSKAFEAADSATGTIYIQLQKNLTLDRTSPYVLNGNKSVVLDLNNKELKWVVNNHSGFTGLQAVFGGSLTIKNGSIAVTESSSSRAQLFEVIKGNLTVSNCRINIESSTGKNSYTTAISARNYATVVVENGSCIKVNGIANSNDNTYGGIGIYCDDQSVKVTVSNSTIESSHNGVYAYGSLYLSGTETSISGGKADIFLTYNKSSSAGGKIYANDGNTPTAYYAGTDEISIRLDSTYPTADDTVIVYGVNGDNEGSFCLVDTTKRLKSENGNLVLADCEHSYDEYTPNGGGTHKGTCKNCGTATTENCTYGDDGKCEECGGEQPYEITLDTTGLLNSDGAEIWFNPEGTPLNDCDYYLWCNAESTANTNLSDNDDSAVVLVYPEYPLAYQNLVVTVNGVPIESTFDDNNGLVFYIDEFTGDTTITITGEATEREFESFDSTLLQSETFDAIEDGDPLPDLGEAIESAWITLVGGSRLFRSHSSYLSATWLCAEAGSDETPYEVDHETANTSDYDYFVKITFPVIGTVFEVDEDAMTSDSIHIINEQGAAYDVVSFGFQGMEGTDNRDLFVAVVKLGEGGKAQVTNINVILDEDNVPTYTIGGTVSGDRITLGVSTTPETTDVLMAVGIPGVMLSETNYRDALDPGILEAVEQDGTKSYEEVLTILTGAAEEAGANVDPVWFAIAGGLLNPDYKLKAEDQIAMVIAVGAVDEGEYELAQDGTITLNGNAVEGLREDPMGGTFIFCHVLGNPKPDGTTPPSTVPVTGVTLNKSTLSLEVNATETLTATVAPDDATDKTVTWESTDTGVATVNENGVVTAVAAGTATITAKAGDKIATCVVTVTAPPAHQHSYDYTSNNNGTHNGACECGKDAITNETCTYVEGKCSKCGAAKPVTPPAHQHSYSYTSNNNNGTHNGACACGEDAITNEACTYGDDGKCTKCGATKPNEEPDHEHEYTYTSNNNGTHNGTCTCGEDAITNEACSYDDKGVCSKCGYEKTYTISGNVTVKGEETPVPNAKVELKKGNTVIATATTDENGDYSFTNVPKGGYNIVVTTSDSGKTKTSHVKIKNSDQTVNVEFPKGNVSSKVEVKENADNGATEETKLNISETVAVGVDAIAEQYESTLDSGKHVEVKLEVEPMADLSQADDSSLSEEQKEIKQEQSEIKNLAAEESNGTSDNEKKIEFLDLSLWMTETVDGVKQEAQNIGDNNSVILSIIIPFDTSAEGIVIYRCHNGVAEAMTNMTINFQNGQEGFVIGVGEIIIYARQFSTYAAAYDVSTPPVHQHSYSYTSNGNGTHNGACTCGEDAITNEACSYVGGACSKCGATKPNDPVIPNIPTNPSFMVSIAGTMNGGKVEFSSKSATQGTTVTITVTPDKGYELETLSVIDFKGNAVALTNIGGGKYTFVMPMGQVSINATFVKKDMSCNKGVDCPIWPYKDASTTAWYHDGVHYSIENGLMNGLTTTQFAPNGTTTRAQIVTILWRLEGQPRENCNMSFTDVAAGQWYTEAVRWAALKGIVEGYSDTVFAPNDVITREQFAAILWRYCQYKGIDVSVGKETNILSYTDAFSVHSWAMPAMQWACGAGVIGGIADGNSMKLDPTGSATRAQVATMLWRFCTEIMNH